MRRAWLARVAGHVDTDVPQVREDLGPPQEGEVTSIGPYELDTVHCADALDWLRTLPDGCVNCIVTSPPYYALRDYGVDGQLGLEPTLREYLDRLTAVFREARRVLRDDGVAWVNMGDSYTGGGGYAPNAPSNLSGSLSARSAGKNGARTTGIIRAEKLPDKSLLGVPWRLAFALQDDGWILRSDCIWAKPNPMPESVTDRPTKAHEYVFMLSKTGRYWYDADAAREPGSPSTIERDKYDRKSLKTAHLHHGAGYMVQPANTPTKGGRNLRTVWTVTTEPTPFAHFATFPRALVRRCVLAGCPATVCATCGAPFMRVVEPTPEYKTSLEASRGKGDWYARRDTPAHSNPHDQRTTAQYITVGFAPTCACNAATRPGVVLDPFMGSGTTALVARDLGRHYIGADLNPEYVALAQRRLTEPYTLALPIDAPPAPRGKQLSMLGDD